MRFDGDAIDSLTAHERTRLGLARSFQLPRAVRAACLVLENLRIPLALHRQRPRRAQLSGARSRRAAIELLRRSTSPTRRIGCRAT